MTPAGDEEADYFHAVILRCEPSKAGRASKDDGRHATRATRSAPSRAGLRPRSAHDVGYAARATLSALGRADAPASSGKNRAIIRSA
jgi:hypothetical protein